MSAATFLDLMRHRRCPYEFMLRRRSGSEHISLEECMDMSVRDAVFSADQDLIMRGRILRDDAMSAFWDSWDRHLPDVYPEPEETLTMIRFGERCVDNHLQSLRSRGYEQMVAAGIGGTLELPDGREVLVSIDAVYGAGDTKTVCRYVCEPGLRPSRDLARDMEMRMCALWAFRSLPGCRHVRMRWEYLGSGARSECVAVRGDLESSVGDMAEAVARLDRTEGLLPRESPHCRECRYLQVCPRQIHELALDSDPSSLTAEEGARLVDQYAELQEKIDALRRRQAVLEAQQRLLADRLVEYSDANGYMAVCGSGYKALIRHEKKVELPEDKTEIIGRLKATGQYDGLSMVNYPRLRSDIAKGVADPEIVRMADILDVGRVYLRHRSGKGD